MNIFVLQNLCWCSVYHQNLLFCRYKNNTDITYKNMALQRTTFVLRNLLVKICVHQLTTHPNSNHQFGLTIQGCFLPVFKKTQGRLQKNSSRFLAKNSRLWRQLWISRKKLNSFRQKPPEFFQKFYEVLFKLRYFPKI